MRHLLDAALSILLAPECAACAEPLLHPTRGTVCQACWQAIRPISPPFCRHCGEPLSEPAGEHLDAGCARCRGRHWPLDGARALGTYDGSLREIIHALKYDGRRSIAGALGARMREQHAGFLALGSVSVPVPLHTSRQRERGFNQARDLARHLGLPVVGALKRTHRTAVQAELAAAARLDNVRGAFAATRHARRLAGASIVLVDDVSTTGATLAACALALRAAGVARVYAITAARAVISQR